MASTRLGTTLVARQDEPLDLLVHRAFGRTASLVEAVLEANRGLAAQAHALPEGTEVFVPAAATAAPAVAPLIQLWSAP